MADRSDPVHQASRSERDMWLTKGGSLLTSNYVVDETLTLIRMRLGMDAAENWWNMLSQSSRLNIEWIHPHRAELARVWFFKWRDQHFSFTDCTSFVVMQELSLDQVLTSDHHFRIAGFEVLPAL